jgi:hypothetical protein
MDNFSFFPLGIRSNLSRKRKHSSLGGRVVSASYENVNLEVVGIGSASWGDDEGKKLKGTDRSLHSPEG